MIEQRKQYNNNSNNKDTIISIIIIIIIIITATMIITSELSCDILSCKIAPFAELPPPVSNSFLSYWREKERVRKE